MKYTLKTEYPGKSKVLEMHEYLQRYNPLYGDFYQTIRNKPFINAYYLVVTFDVENKEDLLFLTLKLGAKIHPISESAHNVVHVLPIEQFLHL